MEAVVKVKAKVTGERTIPMPDGNGFWGLTFQKGETLSIPEQAFHPELFVSLEKPKRVE
jgi:hypothetical protein